MVHSSPGPELLACLQASSRALQAHTDRQGQWSVVAAPRRWHTAVLLALLRALKRRTHFAALGVGNAASDPVEAASTLCLKLQRELATDQHCIYRCVLTRSPINASLRLFEIASPSAVLGLRYLSEGVQTSHILHSCIKNINRRGMDA